jgi:hypothetical protein
VTSEQQDQDGSEKTDGRKKENEDSMLESMSSLRPRCHGILITHGTPLSRGFRYGGKETYGQHSQVRQIDFDVSGHHFNIE